MYLDTPITQLNRVGKAMSGRLKKLSLSTAKDLLFYFPFRYDDYSQVTNIEDLQPNTKASIVGHIELIQNKKSMRSRISITEALVSDDTDSIKVVWFNQPFIAKSLKVSDKISLAGKVEENYGVMSMNSPLYEKVGPSGKSNTNGLIPNYHLTEKLTQKQIKVLVKQVINFAHELSDPLPTELRKNLKLMDLSNAIKKIHFPETQEDIDQARYRLAFDELFNIQLKSQLIKKERTISKSEIIEFKEKETKQFVEQLPFKLTDDQKKSSWRILQDMEKDIPMSRLLNGDVGSGKTLVAVISMLNVALNKKQAVIMVPTEILACQHFESFSKVLKDFDVNIALMTRNNKKVKGEEKKLSKNKIIEKIKNHEVDIIIGTHALVQEDVIFADLALAVIDEQHRFGVKQRKALIEKSGDEHTSPHLLSMTATPIPRSLALGLFGDLDISMIKEKPANRKDIITKIIKENEKQNVYEFIRAEIKKGRQAFVICPLIEESDKLGVQSVEEEYAKLNNHIFPDIEIASLHGKMKPKDKEEIMQNFLDKKSKILVSTSVIEVGVDVPNSTIMMIEGSERFGLAQLHQFRGRVGRGDQQSYCFLFPNTLSDKTYKRLRAMEMTNDGFALAKMDLELRGSGEIYGTAQKGFPELKIATLFDYELMQKAQEEAIKIVDEDPDLIKYPLLKEIVDTWQEEVHLE